jgi:hypothetical protein
MCSRLTTFETRHGGATGYAALDRGLSKLWGQNLELWLISVVVGLKISLEVWVTVGSQNIISGFYVDNFLRKKKFPRVFTYAKSTGSVKNC